MTAAELIESLSAVPGSAPVRVYYESDAYGAGCYEIRKANMVVVASTGEVEIELEIH